MENLKMATDLLKEPLKKVRIMRQQVLTSLPPQRFSKDQQKQRTLVQSFLKETLQSLKPSPQQASTLQSQQAFSKAGDRAQGVLQRFPKAAKIEQRQVVKLLNYNETPGGPIQ